MAPSSEKRRPDHEGLYLLATEQGGFFTRGQAAEHGVSPSLLSYHTRTGAMQRIHPGVYRFRDYPPTQREEVVAAWLAAGKDLAVVSHESALDIWGLTDLIPDAIHLTVPRKKRNLPKIPGVTFHVPSNRYRVHDDEVRTVESSLRVTSPQRTLLDVAVAGASPDHVMVGIRQARAKGWLDTARMRADAARRGRRLADMVDEALSAGGNSSRDTL